MKMKMKMTLVAGALALAVAGQANAAINGVSSAVGGQDLILSIWDTTTQTSYTADLGVSLSSFLGSNTITGGAINSALGNTSWAADATLTSFLAGVGATDVTSWNVAAMAAGTLWNTYQFLSTSTSTPASISNAVLKTYNSSSNGYMTAVATAAGTANSVSVTAAANPTAYAGTTAWGTNFGGKANFSNAVAIGGTQNFYYLTPSGAAGGSQANIGQFTNASFTLASNGALTYAVAAVPEPGEWLLMLSGLALIGFVATRRRKNEDSMSFA